MDGITSDVIVELMHKILALPGRWFSWAKSDTWKKVLSRVIQTSCKELTQCAVFFACWVLQDLALGKVVRSVHSVGGGRTIYFLEKRPVSDSMHDTLAKLGIDTSSTPSLASYTGSISSDTSPPAWAPPISASYQWEEDKVRLILFWLRLVPSVENMEGSAGVDHSAPSNAAGRSSSSTLRARLRKRKTGSGRWRTSRP